MKKTVKGTIKDPSPSGARRYQICLTNNDHAAIAFLVKVMTASTKADAVRRSMRLLRYHQHAAMNYAVQALWERIKPTVALSKDRNRNVLRVDRCAPAVLQAQTIRQWSLWMEPDDFDCAQWIAQRNDLKADSESIRLAIRVQAEMERFRPLGGW